MIPVFERAKIVHAFDRAATMIGNEETHKEKRINKNNKAKHEEVRSDFQFLTLLSR
jgi:hypothetical protein